MRLVRALTSALTSMSLVLAGAFPAAAAAPSHGADHAPAAAAPAKAAAPAPAKAAPAPAGEGRAAGPPSGTVDIRVGVTKELSQIEFRGAQPKTARREGSDVVLRFGNIERPNIARLLVDPPPYLKQAAVEPVSGGHDLRLTLAEGADVRIGKSDGAAYVNLIPAPKVAAAPEKPDQTPEPTRANPVPASGTVRMQPELQGRTLLLKFPWAQPLGAAVFRRGEAVWVVFDAKAKLDISQAPRGLAQMKKMEAVASENVTAIRIIVPESTLATASAEGGVWTVALGPQAITPPTAVPIAPDHRTAAPALTAQMAGSTGVFWLADPAVGDRIAVVTARAPAKGLPERRSFVQAAFLPSSMGLAIEPYTDDLLVTASADIVRIARPQGMALSHASGAIKSITAPMGLPAAASLPALVDFEGWSNTGDKGFLGRYAELQEAASIEAGKGKAGGVQARLGLARFLLGNEMAFEAIGVLELIADVDGTMMSDPEFRGMRGAARAMAGRYRDAQADFSSPVLSDDPASALWRGYIATKLGDFAGAREQFLGGKKALAVFTPKWRARFARAQAESALESGDLATARNSLLLAGSLPLDPIETQAVRLDQARLMEASGQVGEALPIYEQVAQSTYGAIAAPALLRATQIKLDTGKLQPADAVSTLDSIRYRWRGDATELDTIRALSKIYLAQGRLREALEAMRSAGRRLPDLPAAVELSNDLAGAFRALFLQGGADGLQPIQAVGLFYDFQELVPVGAEGDMMVRMLARRLVDVDLLDKAADLLKYQAENRLDGVARAQVSTDLATIQLMNRKPEQALQALNSSRTTLLPTALNAERRVVEARALMGLGRYDHALEVLGKDASAEANAVRAEMAWKQRSWASAGSLLESQLGDRWKSTLPLTGEEETRLIRAGVAYSLADDDAALTRLRTRYSKLAADARSPDALQIALAGSAAAPATAASFNAVATDADAFAGWVARMKKKFQEKPAPVGKPVQQAAAAPGKGAPAPAGKAAPPAAAKAAPPKAAPAKAPAAAHG